jgi:hypothetical protein
MDDDTKISKFTGTNGRDAGKTFQLTEIETTHKASFVLRLVSSLKVDSWEDLLERFDEHRDAIDEAQKAEAAGTGKPAVKAPIDLIMGTLQQCNAEAVQALVNEALLSVKVAPDPRHPEAFRALEPRDIRELSTLGEVLVKFVALNLGTGG